MESLLSLRLSLGLALGLTQDVRTPRGLEVAELPVEGGPVHDSDSLALFSNFTLTVCRLKAEGGGRSPKSFSSVSRRKRSSWWSCGSLEPDLAPPVARAGLAGGSFLISTSVLLMLSSVQLDESLVSCSRRCKILCLSVRVL